MSSGSPGRGSVYRGAAIAVALTWVLRAIGLVSVFILARLLTPSDFGVVGLAMTAVALVETFSYLGMKQALLRMEKPERDYYDTAFTIQLIMFSALGLLLFAIAGPAADFFREPRVEPVIYALSLRFVMLGLVNIGVVEFERDFAFGRDLKMKATARIVSFFVTVALALWLRSYWALVVGMIVQSLVLTVLSYTMQPYRPRLSRTGSPTRPPRLPNCWACPCGSSQAWLRKLYTARSNGSWSAGLQTPAPSVPFRSARTYRTSSRRKSRWR